MSAGLQNNVRLRIFLIVVISIIIRLTRANSSSSVHKATGLLENNFIIYGVIIICSLLPFKATWIAAMGIQIVANLLDAAAIGLGTLATYRCRNQTGCIQTMPLSILTLIFVAMQFILDTMQTWDIYRIIRAPIFVSSATQRVRILIAWALPFAWLVNIINVVNSEWTLFIFTTSHIIIDPLVILMANANEHIFIGALLTAAVVMDVLAWFINDDSLVNKAIPIQISLCVGAILVLLAGYDTNKKDNEKDEADEDFEVAEAKPVGLRQRKSGNDKIKF